MSQRQTPLRTARTSHRAKLRGSLRRFLLAPAKNEPAADYHRDTPERKANAGKCMKEKAEEYREYPPTLKECNIFVAGFISKDWSGALIYNAIGIGGRFIAIQTFSFHKGER